MDVDSGAVRRVQRVIQQVQKSGLLTRLIFRMLLELNFRLRRMGVNLGRLFFGKVHDVMGRKTHDYYQRANSAGTIDTINAVYRKLAEDQIAPPEYRVTPHLPFPLHDEPVPEKWTTPPLIKGYLKSGAWVCGEPAWDSDFHSADLFMMLPLERLDSRYARHYLKEKVAA